ncbi:C4-dicarboxylate TRAP transporter substrate-binding protein [Clostridium sediminicola]|uniref:C4-dicarboxylate TRAP transporter substrate-binding protein n=1 Tax=Clostridium sediminicola TaxID=3114879 RepID=UPI0031F21FBB
MFKRVIASVLCVVLSMATLVGCGKKASNEQGDGTAEKKEKIVIKVGYENNPGEPIDVAVNEWARLVKERSNGEIELQLYPSSQLGSKKDLTEQMTMGGNVITISDGAALMDYVPDIGILTGPFLADNYDEMDKAVNSEWFAENVAKLEEKGITVLTANWHYGEMHLITKEPVKAPEDLKGMKVRCPNSSLFISITEAMGATPTPMPLSDLYTALAQGVVEGAYNPLPVLYGTKMHEQAKHLSLTGHIKIQSIWIASDKFIKSLPADAVELVKTAGNDAGLFLNKNNEEAEKKATEDMKAAGVEIIDVDKSLFRETVSDFYNTIPEWSEGLYERVREEMTK